MSFLTRRWKPLAGAAAVAVVVVVLAVGLARGGGRQSASPNLAATLTPTGPAFPPLSGTDPTTGVSIATAAFHGRPYFVNLWASWCEGCRAEAADIARFTRAHPEVGFLGVDVSDSARSARAFVAHYRWRHRSITDPHGTIANELGVEALPATFFVDRDGRVRGEAPGPVSYAALIEAAHQIGT